MKFQLNTIFVILLTAIVLGAGHPAAYSQCFSNDPTAPVGIIPTLVEGNPSLCTGGIRIDPPVSGNYSLDAFGNTVTVTISTGPCGQVVNWSSSANIVVKTVVVKGGPNANVYDYTGINPRPSSDGQLHSPLVSSGIYAAVSHIDFCYDYRLEISKTASTTFTRTFDWCIDKTCMGPSGLTLSTGQSFNYPFEWTASVCGSTDSEWAVSGSVIVQNLTPLAATITSIADVLSDGTVPTLSCGISFPYVLASGASLSCSYSASLTGPNGGVNTVTVTTSTPRVAGNSATANYAFGSPTSLVDDCVTVSDDCTESVVVCYNQAPYTKSYSCNVGPFPDCGSFTFTNTASYVTDDQGRTGSDACGVGIELSCFTSCTLTPGYWKTHSSYGPAPYDDNWANVGENTVFFLSGKSYYQVLWTPAQGNVYYILARAYIAAKLNFLNGANPAAAQAAYDAATVLFQTYTPAQMATWKGATKNNAISLATTLDNYNNGLIGPGHCSEDPSSQNLVLAPASIGSQSVSWTVQVMATPNPFRDQLRFEVAVPYQSTATLMLFDANGGMVATLYTGTLDANTKETIHFDSSNLPNGVYVWTLSTDRERIAGQIVALK